MYYKQHSKTFKIWMIVVEVIFFIAAIVLGFTFKVETGYYFREEHFNWGLAFAVWASNVPLLAVLYAVYSILDHQETQIEISEKIRLALEAKPANSITATATTTTKSSKDRWICPKCGDSNDNASIRCACGYYKTK